MMCENLCKQSSFVRLLHEAVTKLQDRLKGQGGGATIPLPRADVAYTLYGLDGCPYSARAAAALRAAGVKGVCSWTLTDLGVTRQALWAELDAKKDFRQSQHRTFPIVFRGDHFLGGCDALLATLANESMPRRY
jgi:glutaredoxin